MTARRFPQKHIDRLETMLRHMHQDEERLLEGYGPSKLPNSMRSANIKRAESLELALIWIKAAA